MKLFGMAFLCGWLAGALATTENRVVTSETQCGVSVTYQIVVKQWMCLSHNASEPVLSILQQEQKVVRQFLLSATPEQLPLLLSPATLKLRAVAQSVCFTLSVGRCERGREGSRVARSVQYTGPENERHTSPLLLVLFGVFSMAALASLAIVTFLCCPTEARRQTQNPRASQLSKKEKWEENTYNITDSENPLSSGDCSSFHPAKPSLKAMLPPPFKKSPSMEATSQAGGCADSCALARVGKVSLSQPALLDQVESSLDYGLRSGSSVLKTHNMSVVSSMHSLGPRVSPDGSSCLLLNGDSQPKIWHSTHSRSPSPFGPSPHSSPPVSVPTPFHHVRQFSTPVSLPQPSLPSSLPSSPSPSSNHRPVSIATVPGDTPLARSLHAPAIPRPPILPPHTSSSPPLSPVILADSEVVSTGRVRPYHVVCQPSPSPAPAPSPAHTQTLVCTKCGEMVDGGEIESTDRTQEEEEMNPSPPEKEAGPQPVVCEACQPNSLYQELDPSDDECLRSPFSSPTHIPDPVYERISSIRRHHVISPSLRPSSHDYSAVGSETAAQAYEKPRMATPPLLDCALPLSPNLSGRSAFSHPHRPTLPSRSESFHSNHEYESLPSSLNLPLDLQDTSLYAHIHPVEEDEPESPPYVPENSQRAQVLKIDSQGYALIVNHEEEEEVALLLAPAPGLSFPHFTPTQWSRVPSDYEVPVPANLSPAPPPVSSSLASFSSTATSSVPADQSLPQPLLLRQAVLVSESSAISDHSPSLLSPPGSSSLAAEKRGSKAEASVSEYCLLSPTRHSTISSGQGGNRDSVFVSISEATGSTEEDGALEVEGNGREREGREIGEIVRKQRGRKIYEVENRDRSKSFCTSSITQQQSEDHGGPWKSQSLNIFISFNEDSQIV